MTIHFSEQPLFLQIATTACLAVFIASVLVFAWNIFLALRRHVLPRLSTLDISGEVRIPRNDPRIVQISSELFFGDGFKALRRRLIVALGLAVTSWLMILLISGILGE